jgi:hypothetical protein
MRNFGYFRIAVDGTPGQKIGQDFPEVLDPGREPGGRAVAGDDPSRCPFMSLARGKGRTTSFESAPN